MGFKAAADDWVKKRTEEKKWYKWHASPNKKKKEAQAEAQQTKLHQGYQEMEERRKEKGKGNAPCWKKTK